MNSINWIECKEPCKDCPLDTDDTKKLECAHVWRHEIKEYLELSGDGTVPFDMPEVCVKLGATVSRSLIDGKRPSVQVFEFEPSEKEGFIKAKVVEN